MSDTGGAFRKNEPRLCPRRLPKGKQRDEADRAGARQIGADRPQAAAVGKRVGSLARTARGDYELGAWIDELVPLLRQMGIRVKEVRGLSRIEQVVELAERETGPVIFAIRTTVRNAAGRTEEILHSVIAFRRPFGGVRFAHFNTISKGRDFYGFATTTPEESFNVITSTYGNYKRKTTFWGVGPRLGVNGQFGLGGSGFNVFGSLSGAVLFGKFKDKHSGSYSGFTTSGPVGSAFSAKDKNKSKVVPNVEGELGLGYDDLGNIVAYMRSVAPADTVWPAPRVGPVARALLLAGALPLFPFDRITHSTEVVASVAVDSTVEYGRYLGSVGCAGCHGAGYGGGQIPGTPPDFPPPAPRPTS